MNPKEFIYQAIKLYRSARIAKFRSQKIRRGRSHSISSLLEDLFARFLVDKVQCDKILIDQPISVQRMEGVSYPDISIIRAKEIISFCDLKTDLGYKRKELVDLCRKHSEWLKKSRGKICKIKDGITKERFNYKISKSAKYNVVILSEHNINPKKLEEQINKAKILYPAVEVFVLTSGMHLNEYGFTIKKLFRLVNIKEPVFRRLINKLDN